MAPHSSSNVGLQGGGVTADACIAGASNAGVASVCFLHHGTQQTGELCNGTAQHRLAKIEVTDDPIQRIVQMMVGSGSEQGLTHFRPIACGRERQRFFARKMVKERALRYASAGAEFVN